MAFPVDAARAPYNGSTAAASHAVTMPAGITAGDLLLMICRTPTVGGLGAPPAGWDTLIDTQADASDDKTYVLVKQADGTEGATVTFNINGANEKLAALTYRITGAELLAVQAPEFSTVAIGASTTPNPTTCTPTGGAKDYLWLWLGGWEGEQTSPPASNPANYSNPDGANTGTAGAVTANARVAGASRQLNAASEDPDSWTISASDQWTAYTVAIHPATPTVPLKRLEPVQFVPLHYPNRW